MSDMVERIARTLFYADVREQEMTVSGDLWAGLQRSNKRKWLAMARAAIEAMREPTEAMLKAGEVEPYGDEGIPFFDCHRNDDHVSIWQAMIDAALAAPPEPQDEGTI